MDGEFGGERAGGAREGRAHHHSQGGTADVLIGFRMRRARESLGASRQALARAIGDAGAHDVMCMERGWKRPTAIQVARAAEFLGVPLAYLFMDVRSLEDDARARAAAHLAEEIFALPDEQLAGIRRCVAAVVATHRGESS